MVMLVPRWNPGGGGGEDCRSCGNLTQLQAMTFPECLQRRLGTVEDVPLQRAIDIAEVEWKAIGAVVVHLGARAAALPIDPSVLPHGPLGPDPVLIRQSIGA